MMNSFSYKMARDVILITLAAQLANTDIRTYVLLKVGEWLLSIHVSMYGRSDHVIMTAYFVCDYMT